MVALILLPVYGSWLNPDFAGNQPEHEHIYFGRVDPYHHNVVYTHVHDKRDEVADDEDIPAGDEVVNLPNRDMSGQSYLPDTSLDALKALIDHLHDSDLIFAVANGYTIVDSLVISPAEPPPRF